VVDSGLGACLVDQAPAPLRIFGELRWEDFQRDVAPELLVPGAPDDTHPSLADLLDQLVAGERLARLERHAANLAMAGSRNESIPRGEYVRRAVAMSTGTGARQP